MSFYKNIGSPFTELNITDFEPPYPGGLPECYKHCGENCHLKYYGKDYYFRVRIPEMETIDLNSSEECIQLIDKFFRVTNSHPYKTPIIRCSSCIFLNPEREKSGIHCLLRRGNSQHRCNRCVFMYDAYFESLNLAKDAQ